MPIGTLRSSPHNISNQVARAPSGVLVHHSPVEPEGPLKSPPGRPCGVLNEVPRVPAKEGSRRALVRRSSDIDRTAAQSAVSRGPDAVSTEGSGLHEEPVNVNAMRRQLTWLLEQLHSWRARALQAEAAIRKPYQVSDPRN
jgi:hypothetical protein